MISKARYYVYRNLHTGTFSVKFKNKVIDHPLSIKIENVIFKISKKGQNKVRKEKRKNVHAFITGTNFSYSNLTIDYIESNFKNNEIYYNPYTTDTFVFKHNNKIIEIADYVIALNNRIFAF